MSCMRTIFTANRKRPVEVPMFITVMISRGHSHVTYWNHSAYEGYPDRRGERERWEQQCRASRWGVPLYRINVYPKRTA